MTEPCKTCGHPGPFAPKVLAGPDPRVGLKVLCCICQRDITWDSHQWRHGPDGRYLCCSCMAPTRGLRDMSSKKNGERP